MPQPTAGPGLAMDHDVRDPHGQAERLAWWLRWPASLALSIWLGRQAAAGMPGWQVMVGLALLLVTMCWQAALGRALAKRQRLVSWAYASVALDLVLVTAYLGADKGLHPSGEIPAAEVMLYPLVLLLAGLRLDRWLLVWSLLMGLACCNLIYLLGSPNSPGWAGLGINLVLTGFASLLLVMIWGYHVKWASWPPVGLNHQQECFCTHHNPQDREPSGPVFRQGEDLEVMWPICSHCKKIRDEQGHWQRLEAFLAHKVGADFSHGICPECMARHYPEVYHSLARRMPGLAVNTPGGSSLPLTNK